MQPIYKKYPWICVFALSLIFVFSANVFGQTYINEDFNGTPIPTGWTVTDGGNTNDTWVMRDPGTYGGVNISFTGSRHVWVNGDPSGATTVMNDAITSPAVNTSAATLLFLEFDQYFRDYTATTTDSGIVEVFDGTRWIAIQKAIANVGGPTSPQRSRIEITSYRNANFRVRFRLVGNWPWYFLIDNVRVFQPAPNDIGVVAIVTPSGSCASASSQVTVNVTNFGSALQSSIPLSYQVNGGAIVSETFTTPLLPPGTTQTYAFTTRANLTAPGTYNLRAFSALPGDVNLQNNESTSTVTRQSGSLSVVNFTGFDGNNINQISSGWSQARGIRPLPGATAWRASNAVQTAHLGSIAATINMFTTGKRDWFISPSFSATAISGLTYKAAVTTWQGTQGTAMGGDDSLKVFVSTNCGASWQLVSHLNRSNNVPNVFREYIVPLAQFNGQDIQVGIMATEGNVDDAEDYDFHLDDIEIRNLPPNDLTTSAILSPQSGCTGVTPVLRVAIRNVGSQPQSNFPVCFSINGAAPVCTTFAGTLVSGQENTLTFNQATATLTPPGNYTITVFTNLANDDTRRNDSIKRFEYQNIPLINTFPYFEGFENNNGGWVSGGTLSSWEWGTPAKSVIQGAAQGTKAYVTGGLGTGTHNNNEKSFVLGPCMNFTNLQLPVFEMKAWWHSESNIDGAALQASINGGGTWTTIGALNAVTNWYNCTGVSGLDPLVPTPRNGWSGGVGARNGSNGWVLVRTAMPTLAGQTDVRLRIVFGANGSNTADGFAFDAIRISQQPVPDLAMVSIERPLPEGCGLVNPATFSFRVQNVSRDTILNPIFGFTVNGGVATNEPTTNVKIGPNQFFTYNFTATRDLSGAAPINIVAWAKTVEDLYFDNDTLKKTIVRNTALRDTINFDRFNNINLGDLFPGWRVANGSPLPINSNGQWRAPQANQVPYTTSSAIRLNVFGNNRNEWIISPGYLVEPNSFLTFEVAATTIFDTTNDPNGGFNNTDDRLRIMASTNCGESWQEVTSFGNGDNIDRVFRRLRVPFASFAGREVRFAFYVTSGPINDPNNYDLFLRDIYMETVAPLDGGVTAIVSPRISCGLTNQTTVQVALRNFGSAPISNFNVFYTVNGAGRIQETYLGTIAPFQSATFTFAQRADLSQSQPYTIVAGTQITGDGNENNDTAFVALVKVIAPLLDRPLTGYNGSNLSTIWPGWGEGIGANSPAPTNSAWTNADIGNVTMFKIPLVGDQKQDWIVSPGIRIGTSNFLRFNAGIFERNGTGAAQFDVDDSCSVMVSTDCGENWIRVFGLKSTTTPALINSMREYTVPLDAFVGQDLRIGFRARDGIRADFTSDLYINRIEITTNIGLDVGPIELQFTPAPIGRTMLLNTNYAVSVRVANFGTQPASNFPVAVRLANGTVLSGQFTSTLNSGQSALLSLGNTTFTSTGSNLIARAYSSLSSDQVVTNDTLFFNYNVADLLQRDANATEVIITPEPPAGTMRTGTSYQVSLRFTNLGLVPITTMPIGVRFADGTLVSQTFTGNLAFGQTTIANVGNYTPTTVGTNLVARGFTALVSDEAPANDSVSYNYNVTDLFAIDGSALEISFNPAPQGTTFRQGSSYQTTVKVVNRGAQPITTMPVTVRFDGGIVLSATFNGNLTTGQEADVVVGNFTPAALGTGLVAKAFTGLTGDERNTNDTIAYTYNVTDLLDRDATALELIFDPALESNEMKKDLPYQVSIRVSNLGQQAITSLPAGVRFADGTVLNQTFSGNLAFNQSATIALGSYIPLAVSSGLVAKAFTGLTGDERNTNDTLTVTYSIVPSNCQPNLPPAAAVINPQFVSGGLPAFRLVAGQSLTFRVSGKDSTDRVYLTAFSPDLNIGTQGSAFAADVNGAPRMLEAQFTWTTTCANANTNPYRLFFVATDSAICFAPQKDTVQVLVFVDSDAPTKTFAVVVNNQSLPRYNTSVLNQRVVNFDVVATSNGLLPKELTYVPVGGSKGETVTFSTDGNQSQASFSYTGRCADIGDSLVYNFNLATTYCNQTTTETIRVTIAVKDSVPASFVPPNVVTLNNDGKNDSWLIYKSIPEEACNFKLESVKVFNRWGKEVFESSDPLFEWKPEADEQGTFTYVMKINGKAYRGWLQVLK